MEPHRAPGAAAPGCCSIRGMTLAGWSPVATSHAVARGDAESAIGHQPRHVPGCPWLGTVGAGFGMEVGILLKKTVAEI